MGIVTMTNEKKQCDGEACIKKHTERMIVNSIDDIERLAQLMKDHRLDTLEIDGLRLHKTRHDIPMNVSQTIPAAAPTDEEDRYWNTDLRHVMP